MVRLSLCAFVAAAALAGTAEAQPLRLGYEAYAGGLHVMTFDVSVEERGNEYQLASGFRTRGMADFFIGMKLDAQVVGRIEGGRIEPQRFVNQSKFGRKERGLVVEPRGDGSFAVQMLGLRDDAERTPIPPETLPGAVDPLTAVLRAGRTVADTGSCRQQIAVFDGRRRYDLRFLDLGERQLAASRYSAFSGPARLCKVEQVRIGGFVKESTDKEIGRESMMWIAAPAPGTPPVPVKLELETSWGWLSVNLAEISAPSGTIRLARDPAAK